MAANPRRDGAGDASMVAVRGEDGAWYELPVADLEWTRITDPAQLEDLRNQLAAGGGAAPAGDAMPVALLSPEALATYRVDAERASALELAAAALEGADEVVGFTHFKDGDFVHVGNHREWRVLKVKADPSGNYIGHTTTLALAPPPSIRFPGGFPGVA